MPARTKRIVLLLLGISTLSLVLLTSSLSGLDLRTGTPFPGGGSVGNSLQPYAGMGSTNAYSLPLLQGAFALTLLVLMIYLMTRLIAQADIKQIFKLVLAVLILFALVLMIPRIMPVESAPPPGGSSLALPPSFEYPTSPLGEPPRELIWGVAAVFLLGVGLLAFKILMRPPLPAVDNDQLLREAENAINAIKAGEDFSDVIIHCYLQMNRVLQKEQGLQRVGTMTVREFEDWLGSRGVPPDPVHQLSFLFEKVRYGMQPPNRNDEAMGVDSLNEIIKYCGGKSG